MIDRTFVFAGFLTLAHVFMTGIAAADPAQLCLRAQSAYEKLEHCSAGLLGRSTPKIRERMFLRRGNAFVELKRYAEAVSDFSSLLALNSAIAGYFDNRQQALQALGRYQEALADANAAVSRAGDKAFVYRSRALLLTAMRRYPESIRDFNTALSINPSDLQLIIDRARPQIRAGQTRQAIEDLSAIMRSDPSLFWAQKMRGLAYLREGNVSASRDDLLNFIQATSPGIDSDAELVRILEEEDRN